MSSVTPSDSPAEARRMPRRSFTKALFFWGCCFGICLTSSAAVLDRYDLPSWARIAIGLSPLLPAVLGWRVSRQALAQADELELHITREVLAFTLYATIFIFIGVELFQNTAHLPRFAWNSRSLCAAIAIAAFIGQLWTTRRYR